MSTLVDLVALSLLPAGRARLVADDLRRLLPPADILAYQCCLPARRSGDTPDVVQLHDRAWSAIHAADAQGIVLVPWGDGRYPALLAEIADPPPVLWVRGDALALTLPGVAIVGSRGGSPYALAVAERLAADLSGHALAIVSGMARGVDAAAHRGALAAGGQTTAVLGNGVDMTYPREHRALAASIAASGALVSEFVPGTVPHPHFFPQRNRIISGLTRAVVVVEAGDRSGSLITARFALEQGRDVLAVPGNVLSGRNRGGHALLRDGATLVESADDILSELGLARQEPAASSADADDDPVLACLVPGECCDLDVISERSGLSVATLLPRLCELELQGRVGRVGGGRFVRV